MRKIHKRYPRELTRFKTENYIPREHYTNVEKWDNFSMHVPQWKYVLNHFFEFRTDLKFLELGTGNGMCSNFLLDNYNCNVDTVDVNNINNVEVDGKKYSVISIENLKPFIDEGRCTFNEMSTKEFLLNNRDKKYDFIYVDASHEKELVLTDAILSWDLLVEDGLMIFDDYGWGDCKDGIDAFLNCFENQIEVFSKDWQVFLRKLEK
jgi:predicted O-methyltransferase YrrM